MNTDQLRYFRAAAETLNFTRASRMLYMSQTTLSYQISSLEKELGVALFQREHVGVTLTPAGEKLLKYVPGILSQLDEMVSAVAKASQGQLNALSVGFIGAHEQQFLPILVHIFSDKYPEIDIVLRQGSPQRLVDMVEEKELDLAYTLGFDEVERKGISSEYFEDMPFYAIMRGDNELSSRTSLNRSDLLDQRLCFMAEEEGPELNRHFISHFRNLGYQDAFIDTSATMESVILLVKAKGYVTIAPKCLIGGYDDIVAVPMEGEEESVHHGIIWRSDNSNLAVSLYLQEARDLFQSQQNLSIES